MGPYDACDLIYSIRSHQGLSKVPRGRASYSSLRGGPARNFMPRSLRQILISFLFFFSVLFYASLFVNHAFSFILPTHNTLSPLIATLPRAEKRLHAKLHRKVDLREPLGSVMKHLPRTHGSRDGIHLNRTSTRRITIQRKHPILFSSVHHKCKFSNLRDARSRSKRA